MNGNRLRDSILNREEFTVTWELVPGRGAMEENIEAIFTRAAQAAGEGRVHGITITDNPGGNPAMSAEYMGMKVRELGIEPMVHFTCKDKSRNQMESLLYSLEREGVSNLLVMTGDYLISGFDGRSRPVFDFDAVQSLSMITALNDGLEYRDPYGNLVRLKETNFFAGCVVSPFKRLESEVTTQYYKLEKKIAAGARFIIPQLGYDARKIHELIQVVNTRGWEVPVLGNVYVLSYGTGRVMNSDRIPGCVVTEDLLSALAEEREAADGGREARLDRAAKMYAMMKGMGFSGVHLGGHGLEYEEVCYIIERGEELAPAWESFVPEFDFPQEDGFYYFKRDRETGLNSTELAPRRAEYSKSLQFGSFRLMHNLVFDRRAPFYRPARFLCSKIDDSALERPFEGLERMIKTASNDCQECGDCALFELAYLCPMSQCPKSQRNGACGGGKNGYCEVYPGEKKCIYVRAYERLKPYGREEELLQYIPPVNWDLYKSSSWLNYFLGRDHLSRVEGDQAPGAPDRETEGAREKA